MKTRQHTLLKLLSLTLGMATLFISCSGDEDATLDGGRRELSVDVQLQNADWTTRSGADSGADRPAAVALDEQLELVAECEPIGCTPETPLTRGTPVSSASNLRSMGIALYTNSVFTKTLTATNTSDSWYIANNIPLNLSTDKYSYYAYAPAANEADNGLKVPANTLTLNYTVPADITKQPDLCRAAPIQDNQTGVVTFVMQHALTAVGIKVRADNVEIQSIKLLAVNTSGTLNLSTGTWTVGTTKELAFTLSNNKPETGDKVADITPSDGYLMLPPQALDIDAKKLVIVYKYTDDTDWRTGTHQLSKITGDAWAAGQKINYVIQLKAKFALDLDKYADAGYKSAGSYTLKYTTSSPASMTVDPQVSCPDIGGWITGLNVNRSNGEGTITFDYAANTTSMPRNTSITVTSGFATKTFVFTQGTTFNPMEPITIAGTKWMPTNLTGSVGTNTGHNVAVYPQDYGMFFKWGTSFVYQLASSTSDGEWGANTSGAATSPLESLTSKVGYDYGKPTSALAGGTDPGDPCQKLGATYRTPTTTQWKALNSTGSLWSTYNGVAGRFFGVKASSCNNTTLQDGCIFIPAVGYRYALDGNTNASNNNGYYWSSSVNDSNNGCCFFFGESNTLDDYKHVRGNALPVRCIQE